MHNSVTCFCWLMKRGCQVTRLRCPQRIPVDLFVNNIWYGSLMRLWGWSNNNWAFELGAPPSISKVELRPEIPQSSESSGWSEWSTLEITSTSLTRLWGPNVHISLHIAPIVRAEIWLHMRFKYKHATNAHFHLSFQSYPQFTVSAASIKAALFAMARIHKCLRVRFHKIVLTLH